jgi:UDP-2,4-diacetamido-2,4,6-trideoxy-beta-L-altropyranose hydrolase
VRFLVLTNASESIGLGHFVRCCGLVERLQGSDVESTFILDSATVNFLKERGEVVRQDIVEVERLDMTSIKENIFKDDVVLIDSYNFSGELKIKVRRLCAKLIIIDDLFEHQEEADLIINPSPFATKGMYPEKLNVLTGVNASLLRHKFYEDDVFADIKGVESIFLCLGGTDPQGLTNQFLESLLRIKPSIKIEVLFSREIQASLLQQNVIQHRALNVNELVNLFHCSDLVITSASNLFIEAFFLCKACVVVKTAENQRFIFEGAKKTKIVHCIDFHEKTALDELGLSVYINDIQALNKCKRFFKERVKSFSREELIQRILE